MHRAGQQIKMVIELADVFEFAARERAKSRWDLIMAQAFFDLVDIAALL